MRGKGFIDWEALQSFRSLPFTNINEEQQAKTWDSFATMYNGMAKLEEKYTEKQIDKMILSSEDTVVDIGCGPGRLTIPIAKKVKSVTAVDVSPQMLNKCKENAENANLKNITTMQLNWLEEENESKIGKHDIAIASRSVGFSDVIRLNNIAKKYVFILNFVSGPSLREIQLDFLEGIVDIPKPPMKKKNFDHRMFGYNISFNVLYDLGIDPNIIVLDDGFERDYSSREEAYEDLRFVGEIPEECEERYRRNVDKYLTEQEDGSFKLLRKTKSHVLWWETKPLDFID
ncbi:class I SAM-dependent methyltransferase [Clostridium sp.]|jgi:SAM-dependent methyltransferase|uniref:class I SAM-dependent methyltransferase n=1 Tax=Clostridium sp. TaxID=1506 RepID=UPI002583CD26|nr:class I SAM-dependent methyltransferase [Clostridium sp.]MDF2505394.1 rumA: rRNA (uracil-5-)-methyltransferase RumA [Clostridium sp.]